MMGAFDIFGGLNFDVSPLMQGLIGILIFAVIGAVAYFSGVLDELMGKWKTVVVCFEKRQGRIVFTGIDKAWPHRVEGELTYSLKKRKINIPPPSLDHIHLVNGNNWVFMYFPDRDEGHPFSLEMHNTDNLLKQAMEGVTTKVETKQELIDVLKTLDDKNLMNFNPVVEDSTVNLVTTQLQKIAMRYESGLEKIMKYMPVIATVFTIFVIILGCWLVMGKMDEMQFTVTCVNSASQAVTTTSVPFVPEMP